MTDPNEAREVLAVTQADRDAAAAYVRERSSPAMQRLGAGSGIIAGTLDDHPATQAFARHGLASRHAMDREAVERSLEFACMTLAFIGRDQGTSRIDATLAGLCTKAIEVEKLTRAALSTREAVADDGWLPITDDAKSGVLVELIVDYSGDDAHHPLQDALLACTIGWNTLADTGEDEWKFVGWCWTHDHFVDGKGKVVAWRPSRLNACDDGLPSLPAPPALALSAGNGGSK